MEIRHGISDELVEMVYHRLIDNRMYSGLVKSIGYGGIRERLEKMEWVIGFYLEGLCIAGLWGNEEINLVTRIGYENKWVNRKTFRQFWNWFFSREDRAVVTPDNGLVIPFLLRMGFQWDNNKLVLEKKKLRIV